MGIYHLYLDESGTRIPAKEPKSPRADGIDAFGLGGIIVEASALPGMVPLYNAFCEKWGISYPLHSTKTRGNRDTFAWLGEDQAKRDEFLGELETFLLGLPVICIACVVHRPGYEARYRAKHREDTWKMCRTAYAIVAERSAKYAHCQNSRLQVFFEQAGKHEDRDFQAYHKSLKTAGMPFKDGGDDIYKPLTPEQFRGIVLGDAQRLTKKSPFIQLADLFLWPMVKSGYDTDYSPYQRMRKSGQLIDAILPDDAVRALGVKYSCFDKP